jgi:hypothetical protein
VRSALGTWQPELNRMRILLLETPPESGEVMRWVSAIGLGDLRTVGERWALIDLRFLPTAQAFDRNELDSATLVVSDGSFTSTVDALGGLDWAGSLPSPQMELPPGSPRPTVELTSGGDAVVLDGVAGRQTWKLSLSVPVLTQ